MNRILICPSQRPASRFLAETAPLAIVPLLGQGLVEYWLTHLAGSRVRNVLILSDDRAHQIRDVVGKGERWGLQVQVLEEPRELTPAQAFLKHQKALEVGAAENHIITLDHFPGAPELPIFEGYNEWFAALQGWVPRARTPDRVGLRELKPGIWVGLNSHISPDAELRGPCWLGKNVHVGARAIIGPNAIVENGAFVESDAAISDGFVGPDTYVGRFSEIVRSLAWGNTLVNLESNSITKVPDPFLLCALRRPRASQTNSWLTRISELCSRNKAEVHLLWKHILMNKEG